MPFVLILANTSLIVCFYVSIHLLLTYFASLTRFSYSLMVVSTSVGGVPEVLPDSLIVLCLPRTQGKL